jgi:hypothetical protein
MSVNHARLLLNERIRWTFFARRVLAIFTFSLETISSF